MWMLSPGQEVNAACIIVGDTKSTNIQLGVEETTCRNLQTNCMALSRLCFLIHVSSQCNQDLVRLRRCYCNKSCSCLGDITLTGSWLG